MAIHPTWRRRWRYRLLTIIRVWRVALYNWLSTRLVQWLTVEDEPTGNPLSDFDRLSFEIRPCDVLLVEGRSRVSEVIKQMTLSHWTHAALYIGRLNEIDDPETRELVAKHYKGDPREQLLIEALLEQGTVVVPLKKYKYEHLRICRPKGLSRHDSHNTISYLARHLGKDYDVRQLFDLARFLLPYGIIPRRWRSSLFERHIGDSTRTVCSSMIAAAFTSIHFPILPVIHRSEDGKLRLYKRNIKLYTPNDFDYSPYFEIIKYPILGFDDLAVYRQLPWDDQGVICDDNMECYIPEPHNRRITDVVPARPEKPVTPPTRTAGEKSSKLDKDKPAKGKSAR